MPRVISPAMQSAASAAALRLDASRGGANPPQTTDRCAQRLASVLLHEHANAIARVAGAAGIIGMIGLVDENPASLGASLERNGMHAHDLARQLGWLLGATAPQLESQRLESLLEAARSLLGRFGVVEVLGDAAFPSDLPPLEVDRAGLHVLLAWVVMRLQRNGAAPLRIDAARCGVDVHLWVAPRDEAAQATAAAREMDAALESAELPAALVRLTRECGLGLLVPRGAWTRACITIPIFPEETFPRRAAKRGRPS